MYKNDIIKHGDKAQALQVIHKGKAYYFRHLFSESERYEPIPYAKVQLNGKIVLQKDVAASVSEATTADTAVATRDQVTPKNTTRYKALDREEHSHLLYHIVLYSEGRGSFNYCGKEVDFEPGLLVVTSPNESHKFGPHSEYDSPVTYKHFTFDLVSEEGLHLDMPFDKLLSLYSGVDHGKVKVPFKLDPMAYHIVLESVESAIALKMGHESHPDLAAASAIMKLLSNLARELCAKASGNSVFDERLLKAVEILSNDMQGKIEIMSLSKQVGISGAHLIRSFKKAFGETPMDFNRKLRIKKGRDLLAKTDWGEKRIALETGFHDEFHFAKTYKKLEGETPSSFRRRAHSGRG